MSEIVSLATLPTLIAAMLFVIAALGAVLEMRSLRAEISQVRNDLIKMRQDSDRAEKEKAKRDELGSLRNELQSLRAAIARVPEDTERLIARVVHRPSLEPPAPMPRLTVQERVEAEDGVTQLLAIANRIVQESSTTLDAFRAKVGPLAARISAWPDATEGVPLAFIVEHRGACYAIPNIVKPARLPQDWFNRNEFGFNDEIHHIVSLPRLWRRGDTFEVQEPGVFSR